MNPYSRQYLRERYLAQQQSQMMLDAAIEDPAMAYQALLAEIVRELDAAEAFRERAA